MHINLPSDCGNAPRIGIVGEFVSEWAKGDSEAVAAWLDHEAVWTLVGGEIQHGPVAAAQTQPAISPDTVEVSSIISHGRFASCDGYMETGSKRIDFSHAFRFASTAKTAKIKEVRSYCIET